MLHVVIILSILRCVFVASYIKLDLTWLGSDLN